LTEDDSDKAAADQKKTEDKTKETDKKS